MNKIVTGEIMENEVEGFLLNEFSNILSDKNYDWDKYNLTLSKNTENKIITIRIHKTNFYYFLFEINITSVSFKFQTDSSIFTKKYNLFFFLSIFKKYRKLNRQRKRILRLFKKQFFFLPVYSE